jgi:hypothetical protein
MSYLGNQPGVGSFIVSTERFNGTGSCTQFTITQTGIQDANVVDVIVSNVPQDPINSYSIANGIITFTEAPPTGTQNIIVRYRATTVITYGSVDGATIIDGSITSVKIASGVLIPAIANSAAGYANSAFASSNSAAVYANSGFAVANSSAIYANSAFLKANTPDYVANSAASYANAAFATANTTIDTAGYANSSFSKANSAAIYANGAFTQANTAASTGKAIAMSIVFG